MKKTFTTVVILGLVLGLGACGKKGDVEPPERQNLVSLLDSRI